jgi:hypothetical protein
VIVEPRKLSRCGKVGGWGCLDAWVVKVTPRCLGAEDRSGCCGDGEAFGRARLDYTT